MPVDPRLNCAAGICCDPGGALAARSAILCDLGVPEDDAPKMAAKMDTLGITFTSTALASAIAEIVDHPDKKPDAQAALPAAAEGVASVVRGEPELAAEETVTTGDLEPDSGTTES